MSFCFIIAREQGRNFKSLCVGTWEAPPPNEGKEICQIWRGIRFQQDIDGTLSTFTMGSATGRVVPVGHVPPNILTF